MSEIIHEGHYEEKKQYVRPPNTYLCDTCQKDMGQNKNIELGLSYDLDDNNTDYLEANFCSFDCLHKYPKTEDSKKFTRAIRTAYNQPHLSISGFDFQQILTECKKPNCDLPVFKLGLCTEHLEERVG